MPATGVFVGIDWGGAHHQLCIMDSAGVVLRQCRLGHNVLGFRELIARLTDFAEIVGVAIERAEGLLVEHLQAHGYRLFCVSPKMSARARERYRMAASKSVSWSPAGAPRMRENRARLPADVGASWRR